MLKSVIITIFIFTISTHLSADNKSKPQTAKKKPTPASHELEPQKLNAIEAGINGFEGRFSVPQISAEDLLKLMNQPKSKEKIVLVDVRTDEEISVSTLPGAITKDEFEKEPQKYKDKEIITYCTIGYRSSLYVKELQSRGIHAKNLRGSLLSWLHAGGQVVDKNGKNTDKVMAIGNTEHLIPKSYKNIE